MLELALTSWSLALRRAAAAAAAGLVLVCGPSAAADERPLLAGARVTIAPSDTWDATVAYAEKTYPALFPGTPTVQTVGEARSYRYANGNTIAFQGPQIYLAGPLVGTTTLTAYQSLDTFCTTTPAACGLTLRRVLTWQNLEREYFVYIPWTVQQSAGAVPAVMLLHGGGGSGSVPMDEWAWKPVADRDGFLLFAPSALRHCYLEDGNANGSFELETEYELIAKWSTGPLGQPIRPLCTPAQYDTLISRGLITPEQRARAEHPLADDIGAIRRFASIMVSDWGADARRLYVSGFSNGGEMAHRVAAEASDLFAAAASAAGTVLQTEFTWPVTPRPLSMVYSIGALNLRGQPVSTTQDIMATHQDLSSRVDALRAILGLTDAHSFSNRQIGAYDTGVYVYTTSSRPSPGGNALYVGVMAGLEHAYPPVLPEVLWSFFRNQALP